MNRRILTALLLLALALQGPLIAYSATLASPFAGHSGSVPCDGATMPAGKHCDSCCSTGIVPCSIACALGVDAFLPTTSVLPTGSTRVESVARSYIATFVSHRPGQVFRPPIV